MMKNQRIEEFNTEAEVLKRIEELKREGVRESDIYVINNQADTLSMVRGRTNVNTDYVEHKGNSSWMDRFMGFISGEEPVRDAFTRMGYSQEESDRYYNQVNSGKILLYVDQDSQYATKYQDHEILENNKRFNDTHGIKMDEKERIRLHEEQLRVDKERVKTGEVNVRKNVVTENKTIEVPVTHEEIVIERRPVNEHVTGDRDAIKAQGETIRIPITEERVHVTKDQVVTEEVVIGKKEVQGKQVVSDEVRREELDVKDTTRHSAQTGMPSHLDKDSAHSPLNKDLPHTTGRNTGMQSAAAIDAGTAGLDQGVTKMGQTHTGNQAMGNDMNRINSDMQRMETGMGTAGATGKDAMDKGMNDPMGHPTDKNYKK